MLRPESRIQNTEHKAARQRQRFRNSAAQQVKVVWPTASKLSTHREKKIYFNLNKQKKLNIIYL